MLIEKLKQHLLRFFITLGFIKDVDSSGTEKDENHYVRLGWYAILFGFFGFILWASFAPLDKGVVAPGTVIIDGQNKQVQPTSNGVIDEILVRDGDVVKEGQLLVRLNPLQASAQATAVKEQIEGLKSQIAGLELSTNNQRLQIKYLTEQLVGMRDLAKDGYVAKNRVLELERTNAQLQGSLAENLGNLDRNRKQLAELLERLPAAQFDLDNTTIESPVDGSVINLAVFTKGQYVPAGAKLMEIVPTNRPLIVEAKVPVNLIDKVHVGLNVEMQFTAFNQRITPRIPAKLIVVSADKTLEQSPQATEPSYYRVQAQVTEKGIHLLKDHEVRPGMPVDVFIITGERTLMNYLFKPLGDRARGALIEE